MKLVIFDIDGTLADTNHRLHHIKDSGTTKKNWGRFFKEARDDPPVSAVISMYKLLHVIGHPIKVVTGRPEHLREDTLSWLHQQGLPTKSEDLFMRGNAERAKDFIVKKRIFDSWGISPDQVFCVFEDRLQVVAMWKSLGIQVFVCGDEYEETSSFKLFNLDESGVPVIK